jgi:membrane protein
MFESFAVPISWGELLKRTSRDAMEDDVLGLAAQLAYYFFLALFPAILFVFALTSFLPVSDVLGRGVQAMAPLLPPEVLTFLTDQLTRVADAESGGILTLGIVGAVWSSSAAVVAIIDTLNAAYDIEEGRPWWKVRLLAIGLTLALAALILIALGLIVAGPEVAEYLGRTVGFGAAFESSWKILQWPLAFFLVSTAFGVVYYFAPDAEQDWVWITPGAVLGTVVWLAVSLGFRFYVTNFTDYNATYGTVGGVVVLLLWFYISGIAILVGAELNAEIEHSSPHGKAPGEKRPGERKKIGVAAARAYRERQTAHPEPDRAIAQRAAAPRTTTHDEDTIMATLHDDRSLGQLVTHLANEMTTLVRQEMLLARTELGEKVAQAKKGTVLTAGGAVLAYGGLLALIAAVVLGLIAAGVPAWGAALIAALVAGGGGYMLVRMGVAALKPSELVPRETIESLKEDVPWPKSHAR